MWVIKVAFHFGFFYCDIEIEYFNWPTRKEDICIIRL